MLCAKYLFHFVLVSFHAQGNSGLQLGNGMHTLGLGRSDSTPSQTCRSGGGGQLRDFTRLASGPDSSGDLTFTRKDV